ncbi:hypothetical protein TRICI_000807 [Trichomonascus ciferrii]|uniref:Uncharacterized protein n=1 Tax=Trichomonascus ciferrii TaxID=44093 RepID=A0A642VB03_9ASCO|nr:hypothetical protein TRICI_000807 [Trichomonascus ciferrii]
MQDLDMTLKMYTSPLGELSNVYYGNCVSFMQNAAPFKENPDLEVYVDAKTGKTLSARQVFDLSGRVSNLLSTKYGIQYDDVVCIFSSNRLYTPAVHYGILGLGAIISPANIAYVPKELNHQLGLSQAKLVISTDALMDTVKQATEMEGSVVKNIITIEDLVQESQSYSPQAPVELPGNTAVTKDAYYCFSSGTSGVPKGVMTTHHNVTANVQQQEVCAMDYRPGNTFSGFLPMSHIFGLMKLIYTLPHAGSKVVIFEKFDFEQTLQSIRKHNIRFLHIVPPIMVLFAKSPLVDEYEIRGSVERMFCGAAPLSDSLIQQVQSRLNCHVIQGYGLTETTPVTHLPDVNIKEYNQAGIGWLVPSMKARVVDPDGKDVPKGGRGELWVKGPNVMKGYLKNPKATSEVLTSDGWFKTGDVAMVDEKEEFYIVDRVKELIKSKGHQVAPAELEAILLTHPKVLDAAVIGHHVPEEGSEYPRAFIVISGSDTHPLDIKKWFDAKVSRHKRLWGGVVVMDAIPKNPSGKILRRELRTRTGDHVHGFTNSKL